MTHPFAHNINAQLAAGLHDTYTAALNTPVIDPDMLAQLIRCDKPKAALQLAGLDSQKLWVQAICHAAYLNEQHGLVDPAHAYQAEEIYQNFREAIAALTVVEAALAVAIIPDTVRLVLPPVELIQGC